MERWILPSTALIVPPLAAALAFAWRAGMGATGFFPNLVYALGIAFVGFALVGFGATVRLALLGHSSPLRRVHQSLDASRVWSLLIGWWLVAASLAEFGILKQELAVVGFRADPWLASLDRWLLAGRDAWQLFAWVRHPGIG